MPEYQSPETEILYLNEALPPLGVSPSQAETH